MHASGPGLSLQVVHVLTCCHHEMPALLLLTETQHIARAGKKCWQTVLHCPATTMLDELCYRRPRSCLVMTRCWQSDASSPTALTAVSMPIAGLQQEPLPGTAMGPLLKEMQNQNEAPAARSRAQLARRGRAIDSLRRCSCVRVLPSAFKASKGCMATS